MKKIAFVLAVAFLAGCTNSGMSTSDAIDDDMTIPLMPAPRMYLKIEPGRGLDGRKGGVAIAMWESGLLVWEASLHGDPEYCHVWLSERDRGRLERLLNGFDLLRSEPVSHATPSTPSVEIGLAMQGHGLRKYIWDEEPASVDGKPDSRESFVRAWLAARRGLDLIRPCCGKPLSSDAKALQTFRDAFPGY